LARVVRIDPRTNKVVRRVPFATRPFGIAYGAGSVWIADRSLNVLGRLDPRTNRIVKRIRIGLDSYAVAYGAGSVWVSSEAAATLRRIHPRQNRVTAKTKVGTAPTGTLYAFGSLWVADLGTGKLVRINVKTNRVTKRIAVAKADWITASPDALWVSSEAGEIARVDPAAGGVLPRVRVGANPPGTRGIQKELLVPRIHERTRSVAAPP